MNIVVFGASGNVGKRVVRLLLEQGYSVTAFTHNSVSTVSDPAFTTIQGDIHSKSDVDAALIGADAVISTLGSWGTKQKDILTAAMSNIVPTMEARGIKRMISVTGAGVLLPSDPVAWYDRLNVLVLGMIAPKILHDGENHMKILTTSQLDWTVLRSPVMTNQLSRGYKLQLQPPLPWATVSRDQVAQAIVDQLVAKDYMRSAPFIVNS